MRIFFLFLFILNSLTVLQSQNLLSPDEFLGYQLGDRFTPSHKVYSYFRQLEENSNRIKIKKYGESYEGRDLMLAFVSSEENIRDLEKVQGNISNCYKSVSKYNCDSTELPLIIWMSYGVHGDEASPTETSMKLAYELILGEFDSILNNVIVIIDPCLNPDGHDRYVNWYNSVKNASPQVNPMSIEHHQPWPGGRGNHYLFDLNRDWLWATQVETQSRLKEYHQWMPHVHCDFHEMGVNEHYYFPPAAEPYHGLITDFQIEFQTQLGEQLSNAFHEKGWLFYTKEDFDLFYPGYGDTYPSFNGAIGMTFEQAGKGKGVAIELGKDTLTLKNRIERHHRSSLEVIMFSVQYRERIIREFLNYRKSINVDTFSKWDYIVFPNNLEHTGLFSLLNAHKIDNFSSFEQRLKLFNPKSNKDEEVELEEGACIIPLHQERYPLIRILIEKEPVLSDSLTYDITAWSILNSMGLDMYLGKGLLPKERPTNVFVTSPIDADLLFVNYWEDPSDIVSIRHLLSRGLKGRIYLSSGNNSNKDYGSKKGVVVFLKIDNLDYIHGAYPSILADVKKVKEKLMESIPDFGSPKFKKLVQPKILILKGQGISTYQFGFTWHYLDQELKLNPLIIEWNKLDGKVLDDVNTLILTGNKIDFSFDQWNSIKKWVNNGGHIIAIGKGNQMLAEQDFSSLVPRGTPRFESAKFNDKKYKDHKRRKLSYQVKGAIIETQSDTTHPLFIGIHPDYWTLKNSTDLYEPLTKGWNVSVVKEDYRKYGFVGHEISKSLDNSLVIGTEKYGNGRLTYFVDDPLFRGFWNVGEQLFLNAIYLLPNSK